MTARRWRLIFSEGCPGPTTPPRASVIPSSLAALLIGMAGTATSPAFAEPVAQSGAARDGEPVWLVTVGAYALSAPRFDGAARNGFDWLPIFDIRRSDSREWLDFPDDGFGLEVIETDRLRVGPVIDWRMQDHLLCGGGRCTSLTSDLAVQAGAFAEYWPQSWLRTRVELREPVSGKGGLVTDLSGDLVWQATPALVLAAGPRLTFGDRGFTRIDYQQSGMGVVLTDRTGASDSAGIAGFARFTIDPKWTASAYARWDHLTSDPISRTLAGGGSAASSDGVTAGLGLSYTFEIAP